MKNQEKIRLFFAERNGTQFLDTTNIPSGSPVIKYRDVSLRLGIFYPDILMGKNGREMIIRIIRSCYWRLCINLKFLQRDVSFLPPLYLGSSWFSLTSKCVNLILEFCEKNKWYVDFFKNSYAGDEVFFQTIIQNSIFGKTRKIYNSNTRYIDWKTGHDSPRTLTVDDYDKMIASDMLFARKLDMEKCPRVIEKLIENLKRR